MQELLGKSDLCRTGYKMVRNVGNGESGDFAFWSFSMWLRAPGNSLGPANSLDRSLDPE